MARIANDTYSTRGNALRPGGQLGLSLIVLLFAAAALLVLSRIDHPLARHLRTGIADAVSPLVATARMPLAGVRAAVAHLDTIDRLRAELAAARTETSRLRDAEWRASEAERKLTAIERLAGFTPPLSPTQRPARVVTDATGPFARSVIIDAGGEHGLRVGHPVVSADGLAGRIVEVGARVARVLLATGINSRIPVVIGAARSRAIALGDNSASLAAGYFERDARLAEGDLVSTSGIGGYFPAGLLLGRLVRRDRRWRIEPFAALDRLEHVSVLIVDPPDASLGTAQQTPPRLRGGAPDKAG